MNKKNAQPLPRNWQILSTSPLLPLLSIRANNPPPGTKRFMTTCLLTRHPYTRVGMFCQVRSPHYPAAMKLLTSPGTNLISFAKKQKPTQDRTISKRTIQCTSTRTTTWGIDEDTIKSADSAKMVELINHIWKAQPTWAPEDALYKSHDTRVMNMLFCAAGGPSTFRYPMCPETNVEETHLVGNKKHHRTLFSCDAKLCHLKPQERIEYLNTLYDGLKHHLTNQGLSSELSGMIKKLEGKETDEIRTSLRPLYHFLLRELQKGIH